MSKRKSKNNNPKNDNPKLLDVYIEIGNLKSRVAGVRARVSQMDKNFDQRFNTIEGYLKPILKNHEDRINKNESKTDQIIGKSAGIAIAVSLIVTVTGIAITILKFVR